MCPMLTGRQIAELPRHERRNLRLDKKPKKHKYQKRYSLSRDEMIDFLRRHDAQSAQRLRDVRSKEDPNVYDYTKEFESWANATSIAFPDSACNGRKFLPQAVKLIHKKKRNRNRKGKKYKGRPPFSRKELVEYVSSRKIHSTYQLIEKRKKRDPKACDYKKEFGSWGNAMDCIWGKDVTTDFTSLYILQCICLHDLYTRKAYRDFRRTHKDMPSEYRVAVEYRDWGNARQAAKALAYKPARGEFRKLWNKLGHLPTVKECEKHRVNIQVLIDLYGGVKSFEARMRLMERISEK